MIVNDVWVVNGQGAVGKDLFVREVASILPSEYLCRSHSSVDSIRRAAALHFGYAVGDKSPKARKFLSDLKKILTAYNDYSMQETLNVIVNKQEHILLFIHVREPEEIERLKRVCPVPIKTVLIVNGEERIFGNESDDGVFDYAYDVIVENPHSDGRESLRDAAETFVRECVLL